MELQRGDKGMLLSVPKLSSPTQGEPASRRVEIPTVSGEAASPVSLGTWAGVVLISRAGLVKQEDGAL